MSEPSIIDAAFETANRLGSLPTATFEAFIIIVMGYYIWRKHKDDKVETLARLKTWEMATVAEEHQTATIGKIIETVVILTNAHNALSEKATRVLAIIEERLPHNGGK